MILGLEHCVTTKSDGNQEVEWVANHDMHSESQGQRPNHLQISGTLDAFTSQSSDNT